jgi:hypothetical protein
MAMKGSNRVLVDFMGDQFMQDVDNLAPLTMVSGKLYLEFLRKQMPNKKWGRREMEEYVKKHKKRTLPYNDKSYTAFGRFTLPIMIDGCCYHLPTAVVLNELQSPTVILGTQAFDMSFLNLSKDTESVKLTLDKTSSTKGEFFTKDLCYEAPILLDTGAGPSVMSKKFWDLISNGAMLSDDNTPLRAANNQSMEIAGRTPHIKFKIGDLVVVVSFLVSKNLGGKDVILGRDFMFAYDVSVDLSKGLAEVKNSRAEYVKKKVVRIREGERSTYGNCVEPKHIPANLIQVQQLRLNKWDKQEWETRPVAILPRKAPVRNLVPARTLGVVNRGRRSQD